MLEDVRTGFGLLGNPRPTDALAAQFNDSSLLNVTAGSAAVAGAVCDAASGAGRKIASVSTLMRPFFSTVFAGGGDAASQLAVAYVSSADLDATVAGIDDFVIELRSALRIAVNLGMFLSALVISVIWLLMVKNYRRRVMHLRQGIPDDGPSLDPRRFSIVYANTYVAMQVAQCVIGFLIFAFFLSLVALILSWPTLRSALWHQLNGRILLTIIGPSFVIKLLLNLYVKKVATDGRWKVRHHSAFISVEYILLHVALLTAIARAIVRFITSFCMMVISFIRLDMPIGSANNVHKDKGYAAWAAMVICDQMFSSPVLSTFHVLLIDSVKRVKAGQKPASRAVVRWNLFVTLARNPWLCEFRGHRIKAKLEEEGIVDPQISRAGDDTFEMSVFV